MERWQAEQERNDWRTGVIASTIANANRNPKKRSKPYEPSDFMPARKKKKAKPLSVAQSVQFAAMLNAAFGGIDKRKPHAG
jgi:hypothetical protein